MIRIGEFADLFQVSTKTIRLYEEKNLILPCFVDKYSGYRYYNEKNIEDMARILVLKDLGLSLKEIQNFGDEQINLKIYEYEKQVQKIIDRLHVLKSLSHNREGIKEMKPFVNDEKVIGKWSLIGISKTKNDAVQSKFIDDDFKINELYLLPNGEEYWVIAWTKGTIYLKGIKCPYEIIDNKMFVNIVDPCDNDFYKVAVYNSVDRKEYSEKEIAIKDDMTLPFVKDLLIIGCWQSVDFVNDIKKFNPKKKYWQDDMFLEKIIITPDNDCIALFNGEERFSKTIKYTKNYIINLCIEDTVSQYEYILNNEYIAVEWKSGDYVYGKMINGYYILKKLD